MAAMWTRAGAQLALQCSLLALLAGCGSPPPNGISLQPQAERQALYGGSPTGAGSAQEVGQLLGTDVAGHTYTCVGSLIAPQVVLTAGHCLLEPVEATTMAFIPTAALRRDATDVQAYPAIAVRRHAGFAPQQNLGIPLYRRMAFPQDAQEARLVRQVDQRCGRTQATEAVFYSCLRRLSLAAQRALGLPEHSQMNDLAVVLLARPVLGVPPARLEVAGQAAPPLGADLDVVGYSRAAPAGGAPPCSQRLAGALRLLHWGKHELYLSQGSAISQPGDSGGPAFLAGAGGRRLVGVLSRGEYAAHVDLDPWAQVLVYTHVAPYRPWIAAMLIEAQELGAAGLAAGASPRASADPPGQGAAGPRGRPAGWRQLAPSVHR